MLIYCRYQRAGSDEEGGAVTSPHIGQEVAAQRMADLRRAAERDRQAAVAAGRRRRTSVSEAVAMRPARRLATLIGAALR